MSFKIGGRPVGWARSAILGYEGASHGGTYLHIAGVVTRTVDEPPEEVGRRLSGMGTLGGRGPGGAGNMSDRVAGWGRVLLGAASAIEELAEPAALEETLRHRAIARIARKKAEEVFAAADGEGGPEAREALAAAVAEATDARFANQGPAEVAVRLEAHLIEAGFMIAPVSVLGEATAWLLSRGKAGMEESS